MIQVHIPDSVEELCDECFCVCSCLSRVTFGASSSLRLIMREAFRGAGVGEIHIPDSVEELGDKCFFQCCSLFRVTFGESLKRIGKKAFRGSAWKEEGLGSWRFFGCRRRLH